jgi:hypothetical protein
MISPPRSTGRYFTITGDNNSGNGGGMYFSGGTFAKTGGTISGNDASLGDRNMDYEK